MKFSTSLFLSSIPLFLFLSCSEDKSDSKKDSASAEMTLTDSSVKINIEADAQPILKDGFACFYLLNNNTITVVDTSRVTNWIASFIDSLNGNTVYGNDNLLYKDAGPMGARLNPMADMLVVAFFRDEIDTASLIFKVNGYKVLKNAVSFTKAKAQDMNVYWFVLPRIRYSTMLHLPSENEKKEICSKKMLDEKKWIKNSCTVFKLSVSAKENGKQINLDDYLLATYVQ